MAIALSVYGLNGASTTITGAHTLATATGGTGANISTKIGTSTGYGEIDGSASAWAAAGSLPSQSGQGWILESTVLEGQRILAGTWNASIRLSTSVGSIVADIYMRASKYNGGVYTTIGILSISAQTINTTLTTFTLNAASFGSMDFGTGDKLYIDALPNITTNSTGSGTATLNCSVSSTSTGLAGRVEMDSPGYATLKQRDLSLRARVQSAATTNKDLAMRARIATQIQKDLSMRARLLASNAIGQDTFVRADQSGWGVATDGQTWFTIGGGATLAISSNAGTNTAATSSTTLALGPKTAQDVDITIRGKVSGASGGDHLGIAARITDATTHYRVYWTGGNLLIIRDVADVKTTLSTTAFSMTIGNLYWIRAQVYGSNPTIINAKIWADGSSEPSSWTVTFSDTSPLQGAGRHGVHLACGNVANIVTVNSYTAFELNRRLDLSLRARIAASTTRDLAMRAIVSPPQFPSIHDLAMRGRVAGFGQRDLALRACLEEPASPLPTTPPASFTVSSRGTTFRIKNGSLSIQETIDGRSTCDFVIEDSSGTLRLLHRQPIEVIHSVRGTIFRGFVNSVSEKNLVPNPNNELKVTCIDEHWLADKRVYEQDDYTQEYAGDIAADLVRILADEGLAANVAIDRDTTVDDFAAGTLSQVVATTTNVATTANDGQLELAPAGSALSITEDSFSEFFSGTLENVESNITDTVSADGELALRDFYALKLSADCTVPGGGDLYTYQKIWNGTLALANDDSLFYQIWVSPSSPEIKAGVDFVCTDGTVLRGNINGGTDRQGIAPHPNIDLKGLADGTWYVRGTGMSFGGKTIQYVTVALEGDQPGHYEAYFRDICILDVNGHVKQSFFDSAVGSIQTINQISANGYTNIAVESVQAYEKTGSRISPAYDLSPVGIARSSALAWSASIPEKHTLTIESSLDNGVTWQTCTNYQPIPGLLPGIRLIGRNLLIRQTLTNNADQPTDTIRLSAFTASLRPSFVGMKQDIIVTSTSDVDFGQGTLTSLVASNNSLHLNQVTRNYDDNNYSDQDWFGNGAPFNFILRKQLALETAATSAVNTRMNFAGTWQNFICEVDVNVGEVTGSVGITYRTPFANWQDNDNTFAYSAMVSTSAITLGRGTNSGSGAGSFTSIQSVALTLSSGNWHRLRVEVSGSSHKVYLDDVKYLDAVDSSFSAAGYLGLRFSNSSGADADAFFDNFGVTDVLTGTRVSPSVDLTSANICQDSFIAWDETTPGNSSILIESTLDGGTTWTTCTNGAAIPGLVRGMNLTGVSLQTRATLNAANASTAPILYGLSIAVIGQLQATGCRIAPPLSLSPVGRAGNSLVAWVANLPSDDTLLGIDLSPDGINWTDVSNDNGNPIPFINGTPDPWLDSFDQDAGVYSLTNLAGGNNATWTLDSANSRLIATGGTFALYRYDDLDNFEDGEIIVDSDYADNGGIAWRLDADGQQCYVLHISDDFGVVATGKIRLYKVVSGIKTQLGSTALIAFTRNAPTRFKVVMEGDEISIFVDGIAILTYIDPTPLEAGYVALRTNGGTARYSQLRIQPYGMSVNGQSVYVKQRLSTTNPLYTPQLLQLTVSVYGNTISPGTLIPATTYSIVNGSTNTIAQDLDDLARQSDYWWRIKQSVLYFQPRTGMPSPWIATGKDMLLRSNVSVNRASDLYRNEQVVIGGTDVEVRSEIRFGDGDRQGFETDDPIDSITSITINDQSATFGIQGVDTDKEWYFQRGQKGIVQASGTTPLTDGQKVEISYLGIFNVEVKVRMDGQIILLAAQDGTSGVVTIAEKADGLNLDAAIQLAISRLKQYAKLSVEDLEFTTTRPGLEAGQLLPVYLPQYGVADETFLVTSVKYTPSLRGSNDLIERFNVQCTSGPSVGTWEHLFS